MGDEEREPEGEREEKLFDRAQAEQLLPLFAHLLSGVGEKKKRLAELEKEFQQVQNRILVSGGIIPPYAYLAERKIEREGLLGGIRQAVGEIQQAGGVVKDLDIGLVDFRGLVNDEEVYLCWKLGEDRIRFWHRMDEGFAGRKPLGDASAAPRAAGGTKPN